MQKKIQRRPPAGGGEFPPSVHPVLRRVYAARGIHNEQDLTRSLQDLHVPSAFHAMDRAVELLEAALRSDRRILVVGDFDADGATSSALAVLALRDMGARSVDYMVPNRFRHAYGLTPEIVDAARERQPDLLITVDNGISSFEGIQAAKAAGMQVLVTDHHLPGRELPAADVILNPNQPGCGFPSKHLAGVGVVFYLMSALRSRLRESGWFEQRGIPVPVLAEYLDIVALGTVADVVPLDRNNRILVHQGLMRIRAGKCRPGIRALLSVSKRNIERVTATDLGFFVGPRLNAAGRLDDISHGIECLLTHSDSVAKTYADELDTLNRERRQIEASMQNEAMAGLKQVSLDPSNLPWGLCLYKSDWHQGVIGILASRVKEKYHRPTIVFAKGELGEAELKGSCRSIPGLHIRDVLEAVSTRHPGLITRFGGHAMAAGLTLPAMNYRAFADAFDLEVRRCLEEADLEGIVLSDGELSARDIDVPLATALREGGPWGQGFPEPVFDGEFEVLGQKVMAERHLKLTLGLPGTNRIVDAVAFNADMERWPAPGAKRVHLAYKLDINDFRGVRQAQLLVESLRRVDKP